MFRTPRSLARPRKSEVFHDVSGSYGMNAWFCTSGDLTVSLQVSACVLELHNYLSLIMAARQGNAMTQPG